MSGLDDLPEAEAFRPAFRLIPSRFPPIGAFDTVATPADLAAVMELEGWTNDRLVLHRLRRLPEAEWVFGRANASVIMAAYLHASPVGGRFNGPELGAWYASAALKTAVAEVGHHCAVRPWTRGVARRAAISAATAAGSMAAMSTSANRAMR